MTQGKLAIAQTPQSLPSVSPQREVVAIILTYNGCVGLFKRSRSVSSDPGKWHCITGFVDKGVSPLSQVFVELREEVGLEVQDIDSLVSGDALDLDDRHGGRWRIHTFLASTKRRRLQLNWEHISYRWVPFHRLSGFDGQVDWLANVLEVFDPTIRGR